MASRARVRALRGGGRPAGEAFPLSLRSRSTVVVAAAVLLPVTVAGLWGLWWLGRSLEDAAFERLAMARSAAAALAGAEQATTAGATRRAAAALAPRVADEGGLAVAAEEVRRAEGLGVLVVAREGRVLAASRARPAFAAGVAVPGDADLVAGPRWPGVLLARATVAGPAPIVVAGGTWLDRALLERWGAALGVGLSVADGSRELATAQPASGSAGGDGTGDVLARAGALPGTGARIVVSVPRRPVLAARATAAWGLAAMLAAAAVGVGLATWSTTAMLAGPLGVLARVASRMAGGEPGLRAPEGGPREVEAIARAVNALASDLGDRVGEAERHRRGFNRAVERLGDALAAGHDLGATVDLIVETSAMALEADTAVFWETASPNAPLTARSAQGVPAGAKLRAGEGVGGWAASNGAVAIWPGVAALDPAEPVATTAMGIPLRSRNRLYGVLAVYATRPGRRFGPDDAAILQALARQAEAAIDNVFLHEEAERLSITDGLTGVWNRRLFDLRAGEAIRLSARFGDPFALVLIDMDDFREVNNHFGHQAGDAALVELAARLSSATREVDVVARYGGEEFVLLLPKTDAAGALKLAEKVRRSVADEPFVLDGATIRLTTSVGVAAHPEHGSTVQELVAAADAALYRAKAQGKNRVECAEPGAERVGRSAG